MVLHRHIWSCMALYGLVWICIVSPYIVVYTLYFYILNIFYIRFQVLPLQIEMRKPSYFVSWFGVLNVGITIVTILYGSMGFLAYLKYGEDIKGSVTLNLPPGDRSVSVSVNAELRYSVTFQAGSNREDNYFFGYYVHACSSVLHTYRHNLAENHEEVWSIQTSPSVAARVSSGYGRSYL